MALASRFSRSSRSCARGPRNQWGLVTLEAYPLGMRSIKFHADDPSRMRFELRVDTQLRRSYKEAFAPGAQAGIVQKLIDEHLHPLGAFDSVADVFSSIPVQFVRVFQGQKLCEAGHRAQRFLQIMRCQIGESLEVLV